MLQKTTLKSQFKKILQWIVLLFIWGTAFIVPYFTMVTIILTHSPLSNTTLAMIICAPWSWFLHRSVRINKLTAFILGEEFNEATFKKYR